MTAITPLTPEMRDSWSEGGGRIQYPDYRVAVVRGELKFGRFDGFRV